MKGLLQLKDVLQGFREDKSWNTENADGTYRFDEKLQWLEKTVKEYAEFFHLSEDEIITKMEDKRKYSWPNYYQEANFPDVSSFGELVGIYKSIEEFNNYSKEHFAGFRCPKCGNIGSNPQECEHRIDNDKVCDWAAYGFFKPKDGIIVLEHGFQKIPIFEPVIKYKE